MNNPASWTFAEMTVGKTAEFSVLITEEHVERFADLSGDRNPLHMDERYAHRTPFQGRIAHGFSVALYFSRLIGMHVPGRHALYLAQRLMFRKPTFIGTRVTVRGTVTQRVEATRTVVIKTEILDQAAGTVLTDGEATVRLLA